MCIEESLDNKKVFQQLYDICMKAAQEEYGTPIPIFVLNRINYELKHIEERNYAIHYLRAKKLVDISHSLGYKCASEGREGASLVAYFCKITNTNPLPLHYYCSSCHSIEEPDQQFRRFWTVAYDLPDKLCDKCGKQMIKSGFNVPFESFWGIDSEKETIDSYFRLSFADYLRDTIMNEYQNNYHGRNVIESYENVNGVLDNFLFEDSTIKQQVFVDKYLSLLHDLEKLTGVNMDDISYCDSRIMELFDYHKYLKTECLPVFSDASARDILSDYTPNNFSDLLSVWGLTGGTSLWMTCMTKCRNPLSLVNESISELIAIRENVMLYLLEKNINLSDAYYIMENVRRGRELDDDLIQVMYKADIPEWQIEALNSHYYMFPKTCIITSVRIAWCMAYYKVYYPDSFYSALIKYHPIFCEAKERGIGFKSFNIR